MLKIIYRHEADLFQMFILSKTYLKLHIILFEKHNFHI